MRVGKKPGYGRNFSSCLFVLGNVRNLDPAYDNFLYPLLRKIIFTTD